MSNPNDMPHTQPTEKENVFAFIIRWLMYHGDENPIRVYREGFRHVCHDCPHPLHPTNWRER